MKITDLRASLIKHPLPGEFHPTWGTGLILTELPMTLIQLETEEGITGYGALPANSLEGVIGVNVFIRNSLIGKDLFNTEEIGKVLRNASLRMTWPWGVEMAVWDAIGKACGQPVYKFWGGYQDKIKIYASLGEVRSAEERAEDALRLKEQGFAGIKLRFRNDDPKEDLKVVEAVLKAVGDSMAIMVDANQADALPGSSAFREWDYATAIRVGRELQQMGVLWLEEPLPRFELKGLQKLSDELDIMIAGGEKNQMVHEFKMLIDNDCYDILQGDASFSEGIFQLRKIAALAEANHKLFIPHTWCNCISLYANLQLAASLPNCPWFEYPYEEPGWGHPANHILFKEPFKFENGYVHVPQSPGLGFEIDEERLKNYIVPLPEELE
jgi:L-alanine-DL-glutamate epimerase-like enolase superfamily enzyme